MEIFWLSLCSLPKKVHFTSFYLRKRRTFRTGCGDIFLWLWLKSGAGRWIWLCFQNTWQCWQFCTGGDLSPMPHAYWWAIHLSVPLGCTPPFESAMGFALEISLTWRYRKTGWHKLGDVPSQPVYPKVTNHRSNRPKIKKMLFRNVFGSCWLVADLKNVAPTCSQQYIKYIH